MPKLVFLKHPYGVEDDVQPVRPLFWNSNPGAVKQLE